MPDKHTECWYDLISEEMQRRGEAWESVESVAPHLDALAIRWGLYDSKPTFTVWTAERVYFPVSFDDSEWVNSVARHPDGKPTPHIGNYH